ncbi:MAG: hypothetical protein IPH00_16850 [Flavobacteriales bacterium]|nr:hypothetical protein [Flavobacteriales bacterium]
MARTRPTPEAEAPGASNTDQAVVIADSTVPTSATPERTEGHRGQCPGNRTCAGQCRCGTHFLVTPVVGNAPAPFTGPLVNDVFQFADAHHCAKNRSHRCPCQRAWCTKCKWGLPQRLPIEAFSDMTPVAGEHAGNGLVRYTA